jgi:cytochrome c peroxidase
MVLSLGATLAAVNIGAAAPPQVPSLPSQTAGYVQYAVTNLPNFYKAAAIQSTNNTPLDNAITDAGATLGRVLFYDKRLSHGNGVSCASCHRQENGFSDPNQFSTGVNGQTGRHSMALANSTYYQSGKAFWDERAASLEAQALIPIENAVEMGSTLGEVVGKLNQTTFYPTLFQAAFGTPEVTPERIGKAIGQFERSMVSYQSKFDRAFVGQATFTPEENAGRTIFTTPPPGAPPGAPTCASCHTTNAHVSNTVHNIGLDATNTDVGAGNGQFKSPSLRNVGVRGRFMHDGRFSTLEEVLQFYSNGIQNNPNLDPLLKTPQGNPLHFNFSPQQIAQLVAFMNTLTDNTFLTSSLFSDPFVTLPGDYTGDGVVNTADYDLWRSNFGDTTSLVADGNGDHIVDNADYVIWRQNLGRTWQSFGSGAGLESTGVPEPSSLLLMTTVAAYGLSYRRRRSQ